MVRTNPPKNNKPKTTRKKKNSGNGLHEVEITELSPKQKKFADHYIKTGNATEAYRVAGYAGKTKNSEYVGAHQVLSNNKVRAYIERRNAELSKERIADIKEVKEFWTNVLRSQDVKMQDRLKASEFIAKTNAAFIERTEHTGKGGGPIEVSSPREQIDSRIARIASRVREE